MATREEAKPASPRQHEEAKGRSRRHEEAKGPKGRRPTHEEAKGTKRRRRRHEEAKGPKGRRPTHEEAKGTKGQKHEEAKKAKRAKRAKALRRGHEEAKTTRVTREEAKDSLSESAPDAGGEFQELVNIMARLRGPGGCPWDHEQTLESLRGFLLEETYEVLDAIDRGDHHALRGEIGDLLFEGVFLAQIEADEKRFTVADSLRAITTKLIRRHPHVFGADASSIRTPGQVVEQWERIKAREQKDAGERRSILLGVPKSMPALLRAYEIGTRVAAVGFDWAKTTDVVDKIEEEVAELRAAVGGEGRDRAEEEMGDLLFSIAQLARQLSIEPESALRKANEKFSARFEQVERGLERKGTSVHHSTLQEMEDEWQRIKHEEATGPELRDGGTKKQG